VVHLKGDGIDIAFTHTAQYGEEYYSFVNGQHTTQGGTHQSAFKEHIARTIKEYYGKNFDVQDVRNGLVAAIAIRVIEPLFESQTKIKLGSLTMAPDKDMNGQPFPLSGVSVNKFIGDFVKENVDNYLHKHLDVADVLQQKIQESEKERKAIAGVTKIARERAKKANLHNRKLRDCSIHLNDPAPKLRKKDVDEGADNDRRFDSAIFITEGDSASGSITKSRDVNTQAVFSLRGKPLNCYGLTKKVVYENEEFQPLAGRSEHRRRPRRIALQQSHRRHRRRRRRHAHPLADDHLLPPVLPRAHQEGPCVYSPDPPVFRVRNKKKKVRGAAKVTSIDDKSAGAAILRKAKTSDRSEFETIYCYSEEERLAAIEKLGPDPEITRFKGLGEISSDEFKHFIGPDIRLDQVTLHKSDKIKELLEYYMGKNTMERQNFIIDNLVVEEDPADDEDAVDLLPSKEELMKEG